VKPAELNTSAQPEGLDGRNEGMRPARAVGVPRQPRARGEPSRAPQSKGRVLVVDDLADNRHLMEIILSRAGYEVCLAASGADALGLVVSHPPDLCLVDLQMPGMDGLALLRELRHVAPHVPAIVVTAFGSIDVAVRAMRAGAVDFLSKPVRSGQVLRAVQKHWRDGAADESQTTASAPARPSPPIASSPRSLHVLALAEEAAGVDATVLITGESGVGKEVVARLIHERSARRNGPFFALNCAAISESLVESELFGYERGAFTGADRRKAGLLEQAAAGTFLLDEVGDMPLSVQAKLLRVIETREMIPVGGTQPIRLEARLIAATNAALPELIAARRFREDLYFRLNMMTIDVPPLRERREDILPIAMRVLEQISRTAGKDIPGLSRDAVDYLTTADWKGNVRELIHAVERAAMVNRGSLITAADFPDEPRMAAPSAALVEQSPLRSTAGAPVEDLRLEAIERRALSQALQRSGYNVSRAARLLGIGRGALRSRMRRYGLADDPSQLGLPGATSGRR
jgi:two-component system, NtrC family, response regulator HydG